MKIILLSGGSGKRLFPLSNDVRSKQFLRVFSTEEGEKISMLQRVWQQLKNLNLDKDMYISTNKSQVDIIQSQLGEKAPIIIEPELRDTFPAIALASTYLYSKEKVDLNEVVCVAPVDSYVDEIYFSKLKELEEVILSTNAEIGLVGVKPTEPSESYGYIIPKQDNTSGLYWNVQGFSEKPNKEKAEKLIQENAFWNCGIFSFKLGYLISLLENKNIPTDFNTLSKQYENLNKISFDYEVVEKANDIKVVPYEGTWKDLGNWKTLSEEMDSKVFGKGFVDNTSENTNIINELEIPISVLGLSNVIVAASPDGILISDKELSLKIKELIPFTQKRPMYEERRWGWYKVLEHEINNDKNEVLTKKICIKKDKNLSYQLHKKRSEVWTITSGTGEFVLNDELQIVKAGDVVQVKVGDKHAIKAITDLEFIEVQTGSELIEEDITRLLTDWDEIKEHCKKNLGTSTG